MIDNVIAWARIAALAAASFPFAVQAADANLGRNTAANCANCHGTNGASAGGIPSLAGQPKQTLVTALQDFRAGKRPATIMTQLTKGYTDEQIEAVAAYLSSQPLSSQPVSSQPLAK